jgi:hypothetical protein
MPLFGANDATDSASPDTFNPLTARVLRDMKIVTVLKETGFKALIASRGWPVRPLPAQKRIFAQDFADVSFGVLTQRLLFKLRSTKRSCSDSGS